MQLSDRDLSYLHDMLNYSEEIAEIVTNENHTTFLNNRVKRLAIERLLEIVGEAANHVSTEVQEYTNDIPWSRIIGLRNKIAHDYGEILSDRIWLIATGHMAELSKSLQIFLEQHEVDS